MKKVILIKYELINSTEKDIPTVIEYKKRNIFEYSPKLPEEEINKINGYLEKIIPLVLKKCFNIVVDNKIVGLVLLLDEKEGLLLEEIYIEEEYRNHGIGTNIINNIIKDNKKLNLWVYKENTKALSLYKRIGFKISNEKGPRYFMKYE